MQSKIIPGIVKNQNVKAIGKGISVQKAAAEMANSKIACLLVVEDNKLVGIFSERDITAKVVALGLDPNQISVGSVMTPNPDVIGPDNTAKEALAMMQSRGYRHLPIVSNDKILGILSIRDLFSAVKVSLEEDLTACENYIRGEA